MEANEARGGMPLAYLLDAIDVMDKAAQVLRAREDLALALKLSEMSGRLAGRISMIYPDAPVEREAA